MIHTVTKRYEWDMGHRLPDHDGKCARLHGHRYAAEIEIAGVVQTSGSSNGMVVDFYQLKKAIDVTIGSWDHRTMLWSQDPMQIAGVGLTSATMEALYGIFRVEFVPTAENISREIFRALSVGLNVVRVRVYETPNGWADYRG